MTVTFVKDSQELIQLVDSGAPVAIDFFATWCGPCRMVAPRFEQMSESYSGIRFMKIDVDEHGDLAAKYAVSSLPTFQFYKNGVKAYECIGTDVNQIQTGLNTIA